MSLTPDAERRLRAALQWAAEQAPMPELDRSALPIDGLDIPSTSTAPASAAPSSASVELVDAPSRAVRLRRGVLVAGAAAIAAILASSVLWSGSSPEPLDTAGVAAPTVTNSSVPVTNSSVLVTDEPAVTNPSVAVEEPTTEGSILAPDPSWPVATSFTTFAADLAQSKAVWGQVSVGDACDLVSSLFLDDPTSPQPVLVAVADFAEDNSCTVLGYMYRQFFLPADIPPFTTIPGVNDGVIVFDDNGQIVEIRPNPG